MSVPAGSILIAETGGFKIWKPWHEHDLLIIEHINGTAATIWASGVTHARHRAEMTFTSLRRGEHPESRGLSSRAEMIVEVFGEENNLRVGACQDGRGIHISKGE